MQVAIHLQEGQYRATKAVLRCTQYFFGTLGLIALGCYWVLVLQTHICQSFQNWSLKQARRGEQDLPAAPATNSPVGRIEIPRIGMSAVILEGDDTKTLRLGLGHMPRTALPGEPGNVGVAGHRDTFFRSLRHIHKGDQIVITTARGSYQYRVTTLGIVKPTDTWVLNTSASVQLTLVTCYPFSFVGAAPDRFVVRAHQF